MANENLDEICDRIEGYLTASIPELNNSELEYVLDQLVQRFDGLLERVHQATVTTGNDDDNDTIELDDAQKTDLRARFEAMKASR